VTLVLRRRSRAASDQRGVAFVLVLLVLLGLSGLLAAYLAVSTLEPQISRNLAAASRARYLAEAGIERGFNVLVATADADGGWSGLLGGATTARPWVAIAGLTNIAVGVGAAGTFSVTIRNDNGAPDTPLTGLSATTRPAMDTSPTADANGTVIMRSAGTFSGLTKTIEVVVRRAEVPPFAGAINIPGLSLNTVLDAGTLEIDGRDHGCAGDGAVCDAPSSWAVTTNPLKYGITVRPGAEGSVESALATPAQRDAVKGRSRTAPTGSYATGYDTVGGDDVLTAARVDDFVSAIATNPATTVLQSTAACPIVVTGGAAGATNTPTIGHGCGLTRSAYLGSRQDPRVVFVRGDVALDQGLRGAGVLVVQDGQLTSLGDLEWDGLVIVAGRSTAMTFAGRGRTIIRGAAIASESSPQGAGAAADFSIRGSAGSVSVRSSKQNVEMVQAMRALHSITNWREI
jgi:Tfp pilus assembly protein PilX